MTYKLIILAPSCGGKSTLMRYLRAHTDLRVAETDELVTTANNGVHPVGEIKNTRFIPETTLTTINHPPVVYIANYIPDDLLKLARAKGFKVVLLDLTLEELRRRNAERMAIEHYADVSQWFKGQLEYFNHLGEQGLIDEAIDGSQAVEAIGAQVASMTSDH